MLRSIIELVPLGQDSFASPIAGLYICNSGVSNSQREYSYIAGYFEAPCSFNGFNQIERYKVFQFDRNAGLKTLLQDLWYEFDDLSFSFDEEYIQSFWLEHALMMQQRARKDGCYAA